MGKLTNMRLVGALLISSWACSASAQTPPPPPPDFSCQVGPFIVFFDRNSATLSSEAENVLSSVPSALAKCKKPVKFTVKGNRDGTEMERIGAERVSEVRAALHGLGFGDAPMALFDNGFREPRVPTSGAEIQNRNVQIEISEVR